MKNFIDILGALLDWIVNMFRPKWEYVDHRTERLLFVALMAAICLFCVYLGQFARTVGA